VTRALLRIYLNDHLAGAAVGLSLARRSLASNRGGELGAFLERLVREISEDRRSLRDVMKVLGARENPVKQALAAAMERVGRLKPNGQVRGYSDLSRLIELEALVAGVTGKLALWRSLQAAEIEVPVDLERLAARAQAQVDELELHRREAARRALAQL
jgi:hypothetical protein